MLYATPPMLMLLQVTGPALHSVISKEMTAGTPAENTAQQWFTFKGHCFVVLRQARKQWGLVHLSVDRVCKGTFK
jgi:hypothetical protein